MFYCLLCHQGERTKPNTRIHLFFPPLLLFFHLFLPPQWKHYCFFFSHIHYPFLRLHSSLYILLFNLDSSHRLTAHSLSHEMEQTSPFSWQTCQYPLPWCSCASRGSVMCLPWRVPEMEIYSYLIPLPSVAPLGPFASLLLHPNDKTDTCKVCHCCRGLNHQRYGVRHYYQIVDPVWPEDIGQLLLL